MRRNLQNILFGNNIPFWNKKLPYYVKSAGTVIAPSNGGTGWTKSGTGTMAADSTYITNGCKLTNTSAGSTTAATYTISQTVNANTVISFPVWISDVSKLSEIDITISSSATYATNMVLYGTASVFWHSGMNLVKFYLGEFTNTGESYSNTMIKFKISCKPKTGQTAEITFGDVTRDLQTIPAIVWSCDDGLKSAYTIVKPIFDKYGVKFAENIISDYIGTNDSTYLNLSQLKDMDSHGFPICIHEQYNQDLGLLDDAGFVSQITNCQNFIKNNGLTKSKGYNSWALPFYGAGVTGYDPKTTPDRYKNLLTPYGINICRGNVDPGEVQPQPLWNPFDTKNYILNDSVEAVVKLKMDRIAITGDALFLVAHDVKNTASTGQTGSLSYDTIDRLIQYGISKGLWQGSLAQYATCLS